MQVNKRFIDLLTHFGGDKYVHAFTCQFIAWGVIRILRTFMPLYLAVLVGFCVAVLVGIGKERYDQHQPDDHFDWNDVKADIVGAVFGVVMSL